VHTHYLEFLMLISKIEQPYLLQIQNLVLETKDMEKLSYVNVCGDEISSLFQAPMILDNYIYYNNYYIQCVKLLDSYAQMIIIKIGLNNF
jgi:hypothetical protein